MLTALEKLLAWVLQDTPWGPKLSTILGIASGVVGVLEKLASGPAWLAHLLGGGVGSVLHFLAGFLGGAGVQPVDLGAGAALMLGLSAAATHAQNAVADHAAQPVDVAHSNAPLT